MQVAFAKAAIAGKLRNSRQVLFNLVLDLDAYPRYDTLIIDGTPIGIKPYEP